MNYIEDLIEDLINKVIIENNINNIINEIIDTIPLYSYKENNFGCEHYKRKCKLIMPCCDKAFSCRLCHDLKMYDNNSDFKKAHKLEENRFKIKEIICQNCNTRQEKSSKCVKCNIIFGFYYCSICNLYDDTDKKQFHCEKCGFCRVGGRENFKHCDSCNLCVDVNSNHNCSKLGNCAICLEDLQTSIYNLMFLKCGHTLHAKCFQDYIKSNYKCPLCAKSMVDMSFYFNNLQNEINNTPLPEEYRDKTVEILCNDCQKKSSTKFHFIGLKCENCNSFNTKQIKN
jgi:RING finger and CHY zinc finger domain-containing protein 1